MPPNDPDFAPVIVLSGEELRDFRETYSDLERIELGLFGATEAATAAVFAHNIKSRVRHASGLGWFVWDGKRWAGVHPNRVQGFMGRVVRQVVATTQAKNWTFAGSADWTTWVRLAATRNHLAGALTFAASDLSIEAKSFDAQPNLLNCQNGTLDLEAGTLEPHNPEHFITKMGGAEFKPGTSTQDVKKWLKSLEAEGRKEYVLRTAGSCLHGDAARDEVLTMLYGSGGTGKGTMLAVASAVLGEYAVSIASELLTEKNRNPTGARPELLVLRGARLIFASETGDDAQFAAPLVKAITGRDTISARGNYSNHVVQFVACGKLILATNHEPRASSYDDGMKRRLRVIPFMAKPSEIDENFKTRLKTDGANLSAALNVLLSACKEWLNDGLGAAEAVTQATDGYWNTQDVAGQFVADCLELGGGHRLQGAELQKSLRAWCEVTGKRYGPKLQTEVTAMLLARGITKITPKGLVMWVGVAFKAAENEVSGSTQGEKVGATNSSPNPQKAACSTEKNASENERVDPTQTVNAQTIYTPTHVESLCKSGLVGSTHPTQEQIQPRKTGKVRV